MFSINRAHQDTGRAQVIYLTTQRNLMTVRTVISNGHRYNVDDDDAYCIHGNVVGDSACADCEEEIDYEGAEPEDET
jgi:hypothetical protein